MYEMEARPPYIRFEMRAIEKQHPAVDGGGIYYVDEPFALVTPHGSKDTVEKVVREWFVHLKEDVRQGRFPQTWLTAYQAGFDAWKNDQVLPVNGTPIKNWPAASSAEMKNLAALGIVAVEDLAQANEELMQRIGMGARNLVQRAKDWVQANKDTAPLIQKLASQDAIIQGMQNRFETQDATIRELQRALTQDRGVRDIRSDPPPHSDPADRIVHHEENLDQMIGEAIEEA